MSYFEIEQSRALLGLPTIVGKRGLSAFTPLGGWSSFFADLLAVSLFIASLLFSLSGCTPHLQPITGQHDFEKVATIAGADTEFLKLHQGSFQSLNGALTLRIDTNHHYSLRHTRLVTQEKDGRSQTAHCQFEEVGQVRKAVLFAAPQEKIVVENATLEGSGQSWRGYLSLQASRFPYLVTAQSVPSASALGALPASEPSIQGEFREICHAARPEKNWEILPLAHFGPDYLALAQYRRGGVGHELLVRTNTERVELTPELLGTLVESLNRQLQLRASPLAVQSRANFDALARRLEIQFVNPQVQQLCGYIRFAVVQAEWEMSAQNILLEITRDERDLNQQTPPCREVTAHPLFKAAARINAPKYVRILLPNAGSMGSERETPPTEALLTFLAEDDGIKKAE